MFSPFKKWVYWLFHLEDREREAYFSRAVDQPTSSGGSVTGKDVATLFSDSF